MIKNMQNKEIEFETLYDEMYWRMLRLAYTMLHDGEAARDVVQGVFTRLLEGRMGLNASVEPAYLLTCTRNACLNLLARRRLEDRVGQEVAAELYETNEADEQRWAEVEDAIGQVLSPQDQRVLRLCYEEGKSYRETADHLGISVSAVNKHIVQALRKLRRHFKVAVLIAAMVVAGIAVAAWWYFKAKDNGQRTMDNASQSETPSLNLQPSTLNPQSSSIQFREAELDSILTCMADYYGVAAIHYSDEYVRHLRLYIRWNPDDGLSEAVALLNSFEQVNVELRDDTLIVKDMP